MRLSQIILARCVSAALIVLGLMAITPAVLTQDTKPSPKPEEASAQAITRALAEAWPDRPEWLDMYTDILQGSQLGPDDGWFRRAVAQTRFDWSAAQKRFDRDGNGTISRAEFTGSDADFRRLDRDRDGALTQADFDFSPHALTPSPGAILFYRADRDGNGKVTREELDAFFSMCDSGGQGFLSLSDLQEAFRQPPPSRANRSAGPSKETLIRGLFQQEIGSLQPGPALGEPAPDFTLKTNDGKDEVTLLKLIGPRPVVLVFGNFTCGPFRSQAGNVEKLYQMYKDRATFVMVYVREAHPTDGWQMDSNDRVGVSLPQPRTYEERVAVAQTCGARLRLGFPMLVDTIDDTVGARYSGMPSRLYLIDQEGKVAYKSGRGPFGFKPAELEQSLILQLQEDSQARPSKAALNIPDEAKAWGFLQSVVRAENARLPVWARAFARSLPRTTAAMLELDRLHRTRSPLGPILRGKMRWIAADANNCAYSRAYAEADLRRAGLDEAALAGLKNGWAQLPDEERAALRFAEKLTRSADTVTDDEVARLTEAYGPEKLTAMVLLLAHANFQDRLLLALNLPVEPGGPFPPAEIGLSPGSRPDVPPRVKPRNQAAPSVPAEVNDPDWLAFSLRELQENLDVQRTKPGRIRVPSWEEVKRVLPAGYPPPKNPVRIKWSLVCMGYQPELTAAWFACTRAFGEEAKQDEVFEESLFWVVTRTIHCFY